MLKTAAFVAVAIAAVAAVTATAGRILWRRDTDTAVKRLTSAATSGGTTEGRRAVNYLPEQIADLPAPVRRYFAFALTPGQPLVRRARVTQQGDFAMKAGAWKSFSAIETFSVEPPGFVWDAAIAMAPLVPVFVRDGYGDGEGALTAKLAGLLTVADERGTAEANSAELMRYLAEAVYFPTALLPSASVQWTAIDDTTAKATLTDRGTTVSLDFHFGTDGEIASVSGERHYRAPDGKPVLATWLGYWHEYVRERGMMIPSAGDVAWILPAGPLPYWRGRTITAEYEVAMPAESTPQTLRQ